MTNYINIIKIGLIENLEVNKLAENQCGYQTADSYRNKCVE